MSATPSKGKFLPSWKKCVKCHAIFSHNNVEAHASDCPPKSWEDKDSFSYPFIFNEAFYTSAIEYIVPEEKEDASGVQFVRYAEVIHLSLAVMQLCKIGIGDPVVISTRNRSTVKHALPISDSTLSNIWISNFTMLELDFKLTSSVKVERLHHFITPPAVISLRLQKPASVHDEKVFEELKLKLDAVVHNKIFLEGQLICIPHFGMIFLFVVSVVMKCEDNEGKNSGVDKITKELSSLDVEKRTEAFKVSTNTKVIYECNMAQMEKRKCPSMKFIGMENVVSQLRPLVTSIYNNYKVVVRPRGIIFHGVSGVGKTFLIRSFAENLKNHVNVVEISLSDILTKRHSDMEKKMLDLFQRTKGVPRSLILMDELNMFCGGHRAGEQERRLMACIMTMLDELHVSNMKTVVLATCTNLEDLNPALRRPGRFDYEIEVTPPNAKSRAGILRAHLDIYNHEITPNEMENFGEITHGYVGADLALVASTAAMKASLDMMPMESKNYRGLPNNPPLLTGPCSIKSQHVYSALAQVKPSAMREMLVQVPDVKWADIGGQEKLKLQMQQVLEWPLKHRDAFERLGITPPRGVLLYGPPGCSKTMIAKAVATESSLNFLSVKGAEVFSKWVGESEKAVRDLFLRARLVAPCVIFMDEIDSLASERCSDGSSGGSSNVQERVLSQLLIEMDGIKPLSNVSFVAATNRPDRVDSALLRPGRLDRKIYVPLPDRNTRKGILQLQFKKTPVDSDVELEMLVDATEGYSGAELVSLCQEAAINALRENMSVAKVEKKNFTLALEMVKPRTPSYLLDIYEKFQDNSIA